MKPTRIIKTFADLRAAIAEVAAETPSVAAPPMTPAEVRDSAERFIAHRHATQSGAPPNVVPFKPPRAGTPEFRSGGTPGT
jgi:hypothetical protein